MRLRSGRLQAVQRLLLLMQAADKKIAMVKSDKDNRYSQTEITTHDGLARPCYAVARLADLRSAVGQSYDSIHVIAIDEAQFFPDLLDFCTEASDHDNKQILVAGLDGDFQRQRFGQVGATYTIACALACICDCEHYQAGIYYCLASPSEQVPFSLCCAFSPAETLE